MCASTPNVQADAPSPESTVRVRHWATGHGQEVLAEIGFQVLRCRLLARRLLACTGVGPGQLAHTQQAVAERLMTAALWQQLRQALVCQGGLPGEHVIQHCEKPRRCGGQPVLHTLILESAPAVPMPRQRRCNVSQVLSPAVVHAEVERRRPVVLAMAPKARGRAVAEPKVKQESEVAPRELYIRGGLLHLGAADGGLLVRAA
eukprot:CAMPEP_0197899418 /NCGR_PEP_ID=MMETSP1439-20131203/46458_1 /TAXON_ID=66791 /ORGANISM="Gonyaulax spinifera, Strain CCMP409" /LENGTH=202 /DNA_ID=CAMNT_0043520219 /DNA_START=68 /DNA_END=676 /DNA_ORIENTATION=+